MTKFFLFIPHDYFYKNNFVHTWYLTGSWCNSRHYQRLPWETTPHGQTLGRSFGPMSLVLIYPAKHLIVSCLIRQRLSWWFLLLVWNIVNFTVWFCGIAGECFLTKHYLLIDMMYLNLIKTLSSRVKHVIFFLIIKKLASKQ